MTIEIQTLAEWEKAGEADMLSIVIPAHNEEGHIADTVRTLADALTAANIQHEILVVNDNSVDRTEEVLRQLSQDIATVRYMNNPPPNGFGFAVRSGLAQFKGDVVAIVMADGSDAPEDVVRFYHKIQEGYDCAFGSRFVRGGKVENYPWPKLFLNRLGNTLISCLFMFRYNDITNAFKMYRRRVIAGLQPLLSYHFNLTVELPLKAIVRGYSYCVVPNTWRNRKEGISKFKIREMGSRYLFVIFYCLLEKWLSRNDYRDNLHLYRDKLHVWRR
jgi:dolichol-phosphate mannosyltransferase